MQVLVENYVVALRRVEDSNRKRVLDLFKLAANDLKEPDSIELLVYEDVFLRGFADLLISQDREGVETSS